MRKRTTIAVALASLMMLPALGCGGAITEVRLGAILSLEGVAAPYGQSIWNGIQVAVDQVNAAGGVTVAGRSSPLQLSIELRDDRTDPQLAVTQARELIDMGIPAVIGSDSSDVTLAIAPVFQDAEVVLLSPSSSTPKLSAAGDFIYRNYPSDELEAINVASHVYNQAGVRQVAIIGSQSEFGLGIKNAFIERFRMLGGTVASQQTFQVENAEDIAAQAQVIAASGAPAVYIAGYSQETALAARALREAGYEGRLFGTGAVIASDVIASGGEAVEGMVFPTTAFDPDSDTERVREFIEGYRAKFGEGFDVYSAHGYDAVLILIEAIEQMGISSSDISFYMNTMNPFEGAAGTTTFDDKGDVRKFHRMFVIRDGQAVPVGTAGGG